MSGSDWSLTAPVIPKSGSKHADTARRLAAERLAKMHRAYGRGEDGRTCRGCAFLSGRTYFKCDKYGHSSSTATDWRQKWQSCGAFTARRK